jgi:ADP-heptose:LPS heptosyltransferase
MNTVPLSRRKRRGVSMHEYDGGKYFLPRVCSFFLRRFGKGRRFTLPADLTSSARLLIIDSGDVTDLLFAAPVINYFHDHYPNIKTTILVNSGDVELVKGIMRVNKILAYDRKQLRFFKADYVALIRKLRKQYIETAILLSQRFSLERHLLTFACGAALRIGFTHPLAFPFVNCEIRPSVDGYEGRKMARIVQAVGLGKGNDLEPVTLSPKDISHARQQIHFRKPQKELLTVGVDPGKGRTKHHIIPETTAYLANNLAGRRKVKFLVLTDPWDERLVERFSAELKSEVIDLIPANVKEAVALLSQCDLFISGNTNLFHFAAALNVPTVGLFTKYDGSRWIPDNGPHIRIFKGMRGEKLSLKSFFSMIEEVLAAKDRVLT